MKKKFMALSLLVGFAISLTALSIHTTAKGESSYDQLKANSFTTKSKVSSTVDGKTVIIDKTFYHDNIFKNHTLLKGIDVSWHQSKDKTTTLIDWAKAHADGIDYAFVRIAARSTSKAGTLFEDTSANSHITEALKNNVSVGVYIFSQAITTKEAEEEADYVLAILKKNNWNITLPVVFDYEYYTGGRFEASTISKSTKTKIARTFCEKIKANGYQPMIYANYSMCKSGLDTVSLAKDFPIWLARYSNCTTDYSSTSTTNVPYSDILYPYEFWQFSSFGKVDGYSGRLDLNYWYKDTNVKTTNLRFENATTTSYRLRWSKAGNAKNYAVYRYNKETEKYEKIADTKTNSLVLEKLTSASIDQYKVRCYWVIGGKRIYGKYSDVLSAMTTPDTPMEFSINTTSSTSISLSWKASSRVNGYRIMRTDKDSDEWKVIADITDKSVTEYKDTTLKGAMEYRYRICSYKNHLDVPVSSDYSEEVSAITRPYKPTNIVATPISASKIELTWNKVVRANGYKIYRYSTTSQKWNLVETISGNQTFSYVNEKLSGATKYQYKIRAYITKEDGTVYSYYTEPVSMITKPNKVACVSLDARGKTTITLKWDSIKNATGYQISRYNPSTKKWTCIATTNDPDILTYKDTKLTSGKTYQYKVRAYRTFNKTTYYGLFSPVAEFKTK